MGRIRTVKPEFFVHEGLWDLEQQLVESRGAGYTGLLRLAYEGLWTQADREGRFKWRPRALKTAILPYDLVDFEMILDQLVAGGYLERYQVDGQQLAWIPTFLSNQSINGRESDSQLPAPPPPDPAQRTLDFGDVPATRQPRVPDANGQNGAGGATPLDSRPSDASATRPPPDGHAPRGEGKGREGKGREGKGVSPPADASAGGPSPDQLMADQSLVGPVFPCKPGARNKSRHWRAPADLVAAAGRAYEGVDLNRELEKALVWCLAHPAEQKTADGMPAFLQRWFARAQDDLTKGRRGGQAGPGSEPRGPRRPPPK